MKIRLHRTWAGAVVCLGLLTQIRPCLAANPAELEKQRELMNYLKGLGTFQLDWDPLKSELADTVRQLEAFSGMSFRIIPSQTFSWGQAHNGGIILLDISTVKKPRPIMAWTLAHEWGHEALGHTANIYHPNGRGGWTFRAAPTRVEDEADDYAGRFLAHFNYPVEPVLDYLNDLPQLPGDFSHSSGPKRAMIVEDAFDDYRRRNGVFNIRTRRIPCRHGGHFADVVPCRHLAHTMDIVPCQHQVNTPEGVMEEHPKGDLIPCQHPLHESGDLVPCAHETHPGGDTTYTW